MRLVGSVSSDLESPPVLSKSWLVLDVAAVVVGEHDRELVLAELRDECRTSMLGHGDGVLLLVLAGGGRRLMLMRGIKVGTVVVVADRLQRVFEEHRDDLGTLHPHDHRPTEYPKIPTHESHAPPPLVEGDYDEQVDHGRQEVETALCRDGPGVLTELVQEASICGLRPWPSETLSVPELGVSPLVLLVRHVLGYARHRNASLERVLRGGGADVLSKCRSVHVAGGFGLPGEELTHARDMAADSVDEGVRNGIARKNSARLGIENVQAVIVQEASWRRVQAEGISDRDDRVLFELEVASVSVLVRVDGHRGQVDTEDFDNLICVGCDDILERYQT